MSRGIPDSWVLGELCKDLSLPPVELPDSQAFLDDPEILNPAGPAQHPTAFKADILKVNARNPFFWQLGAE